MGGKAFNIFIVLNLVIIDAFIGFSVFRMATETSFEHDRAEPILTDDIAINDNTTCSTSCLSYIDEKISLITPVQDKTIVEREIIVTEAPLQNEVTTQKVKSVDYLPIPGSGNTQQTDWVDLEGTDFYLSKVDYPGLTEVYFEANMKLLNGNGKGYLRVYDVTNGRAVDGSQIETANQTSEFVSSGQIALWEGYNHYKIQARSLTADTTNFESGRLKIISVN